MLTEMQQLILREAAETKPLKEKLRAIDEATSLIKTQSPEKFFHYVRVGNTKIFKPDPAMLERVFVDEPSGLNPTEYKAFIHPYAGAGQQALHKARKESE